MALLSLAKIIQILRVYIYLRRGVIDLTYDGKMVGKFIYLRSVSEEDADFILKLRLDERLNKYLSRVDNNLEEEKRWIREHSILDNDFYFLIVRKNDEPLGTISLYDIKGSEGEFGRWVSVGNAVENLESVLLLHDFGFYTLGLNLIYSETVKENVRVLNFHRRFGAEILDEFREYNGFIVQKAVIRRENYPDIRLKNQKILDSLSKSLKG